ncbi:UNKNOWN [Stylonychia lemnae]|uniref:Uncharacterized protein n=1 Tax=Stylonychia lemnae TaxID=5949 RepID=A0A077ZVW8_STYLE|nr:UNKNOWN [Stylonychia lemnae]|eukprot:CDW74019.1 UNKNOWN [Stylonychia lemnae]
MRNTLYLSIFFLVFGITQSVLVELSRKHVMDRLVRDHGFFQGKINQKLAWSNREADLVSLDYATILFEDPKESYQKAIQYSIQGKVSQQKFTAVVLTKLVPSEPWESYKNKLISEVQIHGIEDTNLRDLAKEVVFRMAYIFSDWTNNAMWGSQEQFYISHLIMYLITRDSDYYYTNGESLFFDQSGQELQQILGDTATEGTQSLYQNAPKHQSPRYLGITLNDEFLKSVIFAFHQQKDFDLRQRLRHHSDLVPEIIQMNVFKASVVFTKLENLYDDKKLVNIIFNPKDAQIGWLVNQLKSFKLEFKQDRIDVNIPLIFDITIQNNQNAWDVFRRCYLELAVNIDIKQLEDKPFKFQINGLPAGVAKIMIVDPQSPSKRIEDEELIVKGLINFFFNKFFRQLTTSPLVIPVKFPRFDLKTISKSFKLNVVPGYLDFGIENLDLNMIPSYGFNFVKMVGDVSGGYNGDEGRKRDAYNRQQELDRQHRQRQEEIKRQEEERARNQKTDL